MKKKVVKFTKENCPHCKIFDPIFKREIEKFRDKIDFYEISLDDHPFLETSLKLEGFQRYIHLQVKTLKTSQILTN